MNCVVLLLLAQYTVERATAEQPATYTWQIEQVGEIPIPGDCNGDRQVDDQDYMVYAACETGPGIPYDPANLPTGCTSPVMGDFIAADFDKDGDVDTDDYNVIVENFNVPVAALLTGMESLDAAFNFQNIPDCYFPMQVISSRYYLGKPDGNTDDTMWAVPFFVSGNGVTGYSIETALLHNGINTLPLDSQDCGNCDMFFWEGPGLYLGLMPVQGDWAGEGENDYGLPIDSRSLALATATDGIWWTYNYIAPSVDGNPGTFGVGFDATDAGVPGNLAMRAEFKPLCPNRVGDINWIFDYGSLVGDCMINEDDLYWLRACAQGPGVSTFGTMRDYVDLDNDHDVDDDDEAILMQNWTGDSLIQCPTIGFAWPGEYTWRYDTMYWDQRWNNVEQPVDNVIWIGNTGSGDLSYSIASSVPWVSFTPNQGVVTTDGDNWGIAAITIQFDTRGLAIGNYTADMIVSAPGAANSPRTVFNINVTMTPPGGGDCDGDNDVDMDDFNLFMTCVSGPAIPVAPGCEYADFDRDGDADQDDFGAWQKNFDPYRVAVHLASPPPGPSWMVPTTFNLPWWNERDIASREGAVPPGPLPMFDFVAATQLTRLGIVLCLIALVAPYPYSGIKWLVFKDSCRAFIREARMQGMMLSDGSSAEVKNDITAALNELRRTGDADSIACADWYEGKSTENNQSWLTLWANIICINMTRPDTDTSPVATTEKIVGKTVYLHQSYVFPRHKHRDKWGVKGIAVLLFSEWMHQTERHGWYRQSESQHRNNMKNWREATGWQDVAPEIVHGQAEGGL